MKIIFFVTYYEPYVRSFYGKNPHLEKASYETQLDALINDFFGAFGSYVLESRKQGHDAHLIIANCEPLQRRWALENNVPFDSGNWQVDLPLKQTKRINPDIFFIGSMFQYYGSFLDEIRNYTKRIFGWISCPIPGGLFQLGHPDMILTSSPHYVGNFRNAGVDSELLGAFFDERILDRINSKEKTEKYGVTFIGGVTSSHNNRIKAIRKLVKHTSIELFGYGYEDAFQMPIPFMKYFAKHQVLKRYQGEAWGLEMYRILSASQIAFNSHIDMAEGYGINMRMYEATGVGTLLLTDGKEKKQLFSDQEVVYYTSIDDAIEKIDYFLSHEEERRKIAEAGQKRTLSEYGAGKIVGNMLAYFRQYL